MLWRRGACDGGLPLLILATLLPSAASAEPGASTTTHWVEFEAGNVEVDGELDRVELTEDVAVTAGRFRLSGEHLVLSRGPRGLEVDGRGALSLCPCDDAPVSVGFQSATMAPPTDLVLERATLRVGPVPVAWVPWLWLRSPRRLGMLPPQASWRAEDGLFAGTGLHVPLEPEDRTGRDFLDLRLGGYWRPGLEARVDLLRRQHVLRSRFDHVGESLVDLEGHGTQNGDDGGWGWRVDLLRGPRADRGTPELERAARRHDRVRLGVHQATARWVGGVGVTSDLRRGGAFGDWGAAGPVASVALGHSWAGVGAMRAAAGIRSASHPELGSASLVSESLGLRLAARPGPLSLVLDVGEEVVGVVTELDETGVAMARSRAAVGLPLVREFGRSRDPVVHWLEPAVALQAGTDAASGPFATQLHPGFGTLAGASVGLHNALGHRHRRAAAAVDVEAGGASDGTASRQVGQVRATWEARYAALGASATAASIRDGIVRGRGRVGVWHGLHLGGWIDGRQGEEPLLARWISAAPDEPPLGAWFDQGGWSAGGGLGLPLLVGLEASTAVSYDLSAERWLGVRAALRYAHPCRCLDLSAVASERVGRDGVDVWVMLDLLP